MDIFVKNQRRFIEILSFSKNVMNLARCLPGMLGAPKFSAVNLGLERVIVVI